MNDTNPITISNTYDVNSYFQPVIVSRYMFFTGEVVITGRVVLKMPKSWMPFLAVPARLCHEV